MNSEPSWDLYRTFLAVLREQSLSGAARSLGLTQPTVSRHIDALESLVGYDLFIRSQRGLSPTEAAEDLRPYAETLAATTAALVRAASSHGKEVRGPVRLSVSEVVGVEIVPAILADLRARHPDLVIELVLSDAVDDLIRRDADIAVRMVEPTQEALLARRVGTIELGLHAHRSYIERRGVPASLADFRGHDLIGFDRETPAIRAMLKQMRFITRDHFALRADSNLAQFAAIKAGFGIGVCQVQLARREPDLVRVLPEEVSLGLPTYVVMHEDLKSSPRCRVVFDALAAGLAAHIRAV
ncbi:LysR family transcriptional regulator [Chthonobacter albigriseus]|uniref:LysR family transcriptional regulator n=1 Tax=Chthonobacter albigriseus TaxID=1683161 RepID=UPI0015EE4878|nr:LysR family transcriptional regulator [Chthonobacter albigriseus]